MSKFDDYVIGALNAKDYVGNSVKREIERLSAEQFAHDIEIMEASSRNYKYIHAGNSQYHTEFGFLLFGMPPNQYSQFAFRQKLDEHTTMVVVVPELAIKALAIKILRDLKKPHHERMQLD